jgi:hypothetical protein
MKQSTNLKPIELCRWESSSREEPLFPFDTANIRRFCDCCNI